MSREKLSPQQCARLEQELRKGPLAHGFAADQRWTLGRIKTLIGRLFRVGYTAEEVWKLIRRHGWSAQVPVRQALERDEDAVAVWKDQVWPDINARGHGRGSLSVYGSAAVTAVFVALLGWLVIETPGAACSAWPSG